MSLETPNFRPGGGLPRILPLMCNHCGTDQHLVIRSVADLPERPADVVLVSYICNRCSLFSEHPASVADLSIVLGRTDQTGDVLIFGSQYLHCGRPMTKAGSELRRFSAPPPRKEADDDTLDVYLSARVLHCECGFRLQVPD